MSGSAILTNTGLLKIASASPLDQLTITDIAVGDGVNPLSPTATGLVSEVYRNTASTPIRSTTYPDTLVFELNIPPTTGGFTVREIGAFDTDGDLIAVGTLDEIAKPTDGINLTVQINVKLQTAAQVDVFYDNQGAIDFEGLRNRNASALNTNTTESTQDFIDSFALKTFQSPTDGLTEINTRTLSGGEVYEVREVSDDSLATIYSDVAGTTEIVQNGTDNVSGSDGVVEFYIDNGGYYIEVGSVKSNFNANYNREIKSTEVFANLKLQAGSKVKTKQYSEAILGGGADYVIYTLDAYRVEINDPLWTADNIMDFDLANGNVAVYCSEFSHVTLSQLGVKGDGTDETAEIDNAITAFNESTIAKLSCVYNKTYKYNGAGLYITSDKTVYGNLSEWVTDTGSLLFLTDGNYSNHANNVTFKKIRTTGFDDPIQLLFADNSLITRCEVNDCGNIGIQVKGDELVGNVVEKNVVDGAVFHCFATNDSVNFNPANTEQGRRYPTDTTFRDNTAKNATQLAYNVHSNSLNGISRVYGGYVKNCGLIMKNSYGNQIWKDVTVVKEASAPVGSGWLFQAGAGSPTSNPDAYAQISGGSIEINKTESLFLISGNCDIKDMDVIYTGANDTEVQLYQLANQDEIKTCRINDITYKGARMKWNFGALLNDANSAGVNECFEFTGHTFENGLSLNDATDPLFKFGSGIYKILNISNNNFNIHNTSSTATLINFSGTQASSVYICGNVTGDKNLVISASGATSVESLQVKSNDGVRLDARNPTRFKNVFLTDNTPRNTSLESVSDNIGAQSKLVVDFDYGAEYELYISTDLSSAGGLFLNKVKYSLLTSRDGTQIISGFSDVVGDEADIGLVFSTNGSDIDYYCVTTGTYFINLRKVNDR